MGEWLLLSGVALEKLARDRHQSIDSLPQNRRSRLTYMQLDARRQGYAPPALSRPGRRAFGRWLG